MSDHSKIQWCDATWNPTTGCTRVSEGCRHCYIETTPPFRIAGRKFINGSTGVQLHPDRLDQPLHWRKPRRIFVNSLSDLFHEDVPDQFIDKVFAVMGSEEAGQHTFQVLTKRPERMLRYTQRFTRHDIEFDKLFPQVQLGVSIDDQRTADERIPLLLQTPAAVRFVSAEPLLGLVDLSRWFQFYDEGKSFARLNEPVAHVVPKGQDKALNLVIVGGESGPGARPCDLAWIRSIVEQCQAAGVKVFVKQWGSYPVMGYYEAQDWCDERGWEFGDDGEWTCVGWDERDGQPPPSVKVRVPLKDKKGGDPAEWPADLRVRELPG